MPLSTGMRAKNALKASMPPAEAPMPTTRRVRSAGAAGGPAASAPGSAASPVLPLAPVVPLLPGRVGLAATLPHPHPFFAAAAVLHPTNGESER